MPPESQEPRHLTVDEAVAAIAHFNSDRPVSADKLRRWVREGKIDATRLRNSTRILITVPELVMKGHLHPDALEWSGEELPVSVPDSLPTSWTSEPGPLERRLAAASTSADQEQDTDDAFGDEAADALLEPTYDETPHFADDEQPSGPEAHEAADVFADDTDEDLAPARPAAAGLAGPAVRPKRQRTPRERTTPRVRQDRPSLSARPGRALAVAAVLLLAAVGGGIAWTSSDGGNDPARADASRTPTNTRLSNEARAEQNATNAMRATMEAAAAAGDFKLAIARAEQLSDASSEERYKLAAAAILVRRASKAVERGDLDRARGLVQRSRRYAATPGAEKVSRRADAIETARRVRKAKRLADAREARARRAAAARRRAATVSPSQPAASSGSTSSTPSSSAPSSSHPTSVSPPAATQTPSSGGSSSSSGGSSSSSSSGSTQKSNSSSSTNDYHLPPAPAPAAAD